MKEIPLTKGQVALVDDEDYKYLMQWKWHAHWDKHTRSYYARRGERIGIGNKTRTIIMHREIMKTPDGFICDHRDHVTLNNQKYNLRNVTNSQNAMNRTGEQRDRKFQLGARGVHTVGKKFRAQITINGRIKKFPVRHSIEEATADRKNAEIEYYGEYRGK